MSFIKSVVFFLSFFIFSSAHSQVNEYFDQIKNSPNALYAFFKAMPKGGELHYHLAGGSYPETMLSLASTGDYCLDKNTFAVSKNTIPCNGVKSNELFSNPEFYEQTLRSWSMKNFIPGQETAHDHFFNSFNKYIPIVFDYRPQLIADVVKRAAQQEERYMELMDIPDNANSLRFGELIKNNASLDDKKQALLANKEFQNNINSAVLETDKNLEKAREELGCTRNPQSKPCQMHIKFIYYVLRGQSIDKVFAQALSAFEAVSRSKGTLAGVNLVQPEDGAISLRDYQKQMHIFNYLHKIYPKVPITLHAGELTLEYGTPEDLSNHIKEAIMTGHAQRIGHGVDISSEDQAEETLHYMAEHHIAVEINLTSNRTLFQVSGRNHPLNYYLAHQVPVVLSTDDEGVLRTDLTHQYVEAALVHGLNYSTLKLINRNALTYSFLPGKSIWADASKAELIPDCQSLNSATCSQFLKNNEKGQLQWDLEQQLIRFERNY